MTTQIKLKRKYRVDFRSNYKGGERPAPKKHRKKLNDTAKQKLPKQSQVALVVDGKTGHGRFQKTGGDG